MFNRLRSFVLQKTNLINSLSILFYVFRLFPINKRKIVVTSYNGKGYGDNGKYIVEALHGDVKCNIYWVVKNKQIAESLPSWIKPVKKNSILYFYHMSTAKIWINNSRFSSFVKKRNGQYYIQTWHSSLRLKKIELDIKEKLSNSYLRDIKNDSKMIDLLISGSAFSSKIYKRAFDYSGEILECGTPRCDIFFDSVQKENVMERVDTFYNLTSKKSYLYAPTFRNNQKDNSWMMDISYVLNKIDGNMFFRLHPNTKIEFKGNDFEDLDLSKYPDMQELLIAFDCLITDYSGCCFDMMILGKLCILFVKDLDDYLCNDRDLYFKFDELPFPIARSEDELVDIINNFDLLDYLNKVESFKEKIGLLEEGNASIRIAQRIKEVIGNEKI